MTPDEKANELIEMFAKELWDTGSYSGVLEKQAKACAIIAVDEIIFAYENHSDVRSISYWNEVKYILSK